MGSKRKRAAEHRAAEELERLKQKALRKLTNTPEPTIDNAVREYTIGTRMSKKVVDGMFSFPPTLTGFKSIKKPNYSGGRSIAQNLTYRRKG